MSDHRDDEIDLFLAKVGWAKADRTALAGDASARRYWRLNLRGQRGVLMDAPLGQADDPAQFLQIADHLALLGLSPPRCLAKDLSKGFLLLEDLGDGVFARLIDHDPTRELSLFQGAVDVLVHLQSAPAPPGLPNLTAQDWAASTLIAITQYRAGIVDDPYDPAPFLAALTFALRAHADGPRVLVLRDYHSENLLFLPDRAGIAQTGLLDFQLGQMGQPAYDLVSLLQDARRDVSPETESFLRQYFGAKTHQDETLFSAQYAALGALRALRILGIFAQLCRKGGKPHYLTLLPRVYRQLFRNLEHPKLADLRAICEQALPEPTPVHIERLRSQCGHFPL